MRHIVKKQTIELRLDIRQDAFRVQNNMSEFYWKKIVPELESIFDELSDDNVFFQIDKLEIDLGVFNVEYLLSTKNLIDLFPDIRAKIKEAIILHVRKTSAEKIGGVTAQWLFYMEKGYLNWNTLTPDASWDQKVIEKFATDYLSITSLRKLVGRNEKALHRIATRHNELFIKRLIEVLTTENQDELLQFVKELYKLFEHDRQLKESVQSRNLIVQRKIWEKIIWIAATGKEKQKSAELAAEIVRWLVAKGTEKLWLEIASTSRLPYLHQLINKVFSTEIEKEERKKTIGGDRAKVDDEKIGSETGEQKKGKDFVKKGIQKKPVPKQTKRTDEAILDDALHKIVQERNTISDTKCQEENNVARQSEKSEQRTIVSDNIAAQEEGATDPKSTESVITENYSELPPFEAKVDPKVLEDGIFVHHAGLVLLHPFLISLFTRLNLVHEGKFINRESQQRALYVLHFLATGKDDVEEYEFLLPKFLTNYPMEEIIPVSYILSDLEKEEANNLLEAVIEKWDILRSTSPAGLRESFLQRQGKLYSKNSNYYLQVEAGTIDMLLDHLPWNLSIIKLPWMKEILRVEWR